MVRGYTVDVVGLRAAAPAVKTGVEEAEARLLPGPAVEGRDDNEEDVDVDEEREEENDGVSLPVVADDPTVWYGSDDTGVLDIGGI